MAVDDIEKCVAKLIQKGAAVLLRIENVGGGIRVATVIDPWRNTIGLIAGA